MAFVAGVADSTGYGWAIARSLSNAGATIVVGTWPPVLKIFQIGLRKGDFDADAELPDGGKMEIDKVYPLDAVFDKPEDVPESVSSNKVRKGVGEGLWEGREGCDTPVMGGHIKGFSRI